MKVRGCGFGQPSCDFLLALPMRGGLNHLMRRVAGSIVIYQVLLERKETRQHKRHCC
jgi:hypothetical protein